MFRRSNCDSFGQVVFTIYGFGSLLGEWESKLVPLIRINGEVAFEGSRLILVKLELGFTYSIAWCLRKENYCKPGYRLYRNRLVAEKYYFEVDRNEISEKRIRDAKIHSIGISARAPESPLYNQDLEKNCPRLTIAPAAVRDTEEGFCPEIVHTRGILTAWSRRSVTPVP